MVEKKYHCPFCKAKFDTAKALQIHIQDMHKRSAKEKIVDFFQPNKKLVTKLVDKPFKL